MNYDYHEDDTHTKAQVLAYANDIRTSLGLKPATRLWKGVQDENTSCPISNTVRGRKANLLVSTTLEEVRAQLIGDSVKVFANPDAAINFIEHFDDGCYPELIAR